MDTKIQQEAEFLFRRTQEKLADGIVLVPVLFAFAVLVLIGLFLRQKRGSGLLLSALAGGVVTGLWALGALTFEAWSTRFVICLIGAVVQLGVLIVFVVRQKPDLIVAPLLGGLSLVYVAVGLLLKPAFSWWIVVAPVLLIALVYVALMYIRDSRSVNPAMAAFLGVLRSLVYVILALVFLLPGCQTYDTTESHAKVLLLLDVSGSMSTIDDLPESGQDPTKLPSRQDKVIQALAVQVPGSKIKTPLLTGVLDKSPLSAYRFGGLADDVNVLQFREGDSYSEQKWSDFLKLDKKKIVVPADLPAVDQAKLRAKLNDLYDSLWGGTNVPGSALQVVKLEAGSYVQAVVIISDGQSNIGGDAIKELLERVNSSKRKIPLITIGVGEYRQPVSIRIEDLQAPETARPDDKFPVRVPVVGAGLADEDFEVTLEAQRIMDKEGRPTAGDRKFILGPSRGKFQGVGDNPHGTVEFMIDLQDLTKVKAADDEAAALEGTWQFVARVPRHKHEAFPKDEHASDPPTRVLVQKRKLRVLLFADGPTRDYLFLRPLFYREVLEKRMELAVYLQTGRGDDVNQDVDPEWLLTHFPDRLGPDNPADKHSSLNEYDVIIACDPDWTALEPQQLEMVREWVGKHAGGIIFIGGPVNTFHLPRPAGRDLTPLKTIFPVELKDSRLHSLGIDLDTSRPYALHFTPAAREYEFLKLDEEGEGPTAGWDQFFWGGKAPQESKDMRPKRGAFNYYPVEKLRPASRTIATFAGPPSSRINDGKDEQPYMVVMPYEGGKTFFLSSGETWRLRQFKAAFHERFWIKLARYMSAGTSMQKKYGFIPMGRFHKTGTISFEAQIKNVNLQPLPREDAPTVFLKRPENFDPKLDPETPESFIMRPKNTQGEWQGWFTASFKVRTPGEYEIRIPIPGVSEPLSHRFVVRQPDVEMDNVRNNFKELYKLASDAKLVLPALSPEARRELEKVLKPPADQDLKDLKDLSEGKETTRLFFNLKDAGLVPECLRRLQPKRESTKGRLLDLWDQGFVSQHLVDAYEMSAYYVFLLVPAVIGLLCAGILFIMRRNLAGIIVVAGTGVVALGVFFIDATAKPSWEDMPLDMSFVLGVVVTLLSVEWLTRKLLKLA
jgi:hypothetical protein